ncbi:methyltransferase-like protein 22 [Leptinotarsa decemlineata]|uniref:methyltransferase-like protein 22 n=1 Tax=Leptinotarsa decemlineata TaxID=7539 RepID=UPI003D30A108
MLYYNGYGLKGLRKGCGGQTGGMDDEDNQVSSEIFEEYNYIDSTKQAHKLNYVVSKFNFILPEYGVTVDADGDLDVRRRNAEPPKSSIEIEHMKSTALDMVGLQLWRGALLLADWLIDNHKVIPKNSLVLELGSGVGLTSIVASTFFPVLCTDINRGDILGLIERNVKRNKNICRHRVEVLELDFMSSDIPDEIVRHLPNVSLIIAADTVYDDSITRAFMKTIQKLLSMSRRMSVYIALEKRYVFTLSDCDTAAPCYEFYLECLANMKNVKYEEVPLNFPKYFEYDRVKELVLWKLTSVVK